MSLDFTLGKYHELCESIVSSGYVPMTVRKYLENENPPSSFLILRHDVDSQSMRVWKTAQIERDMGISATYYFRYTADVFKPEVIKGVADMGHEIGYHYEVLDRAKGDLERAIGIFSSELNAFRQLVEVRTISMHGNPLTHWDNRDLWRKYDFKSFGIVGEAYLSLSDVVYLSDTGRTWGPEHKVKDWLPADANRPSIVKPAVHSTDDLIKMIVRREFERLCLNTHPGRWGDNMFYWTISLVYDTLVNVIKRAAMSILHQRGGVDDHL